MSNAVGFVMAFGMFGAVFSATGGYASGQDFVDGMCAGQVVGAVVLAAAALLALVIPENRRPAGTAVLPQL